MHTILRSMNYVYVCEGNGSNLKITWTEGKLIGWCFNKKEKGLAWIKLAECTR